jgi:hypothetical protein
MVAAEAQGFGRRCMDYCAPACAPCVTVSYVDKVVTCHKPEWREEKAKVKVNKVYCRVEEVPVKCTVMVPKWTDEQRTCKYLVPVPRVVERDVVRCRYVPHSCTDPCTGCTYTCYRPETWTEKVKCTVYDCKEETKQIVVKVCHYEPKVYETKQRRYIPECREEVVDVVRRYCVMVPYQTTVKVAVYTPCCDSAPAAHAHP